MVSLLRSSLLLALWLLFSRAVFAEAEETSVDNLSPPSACLNCSLCGSCYPNAPPPPDYTRYGVPPPPPPPPPPPASAQAECPPTVVQCCQYPYPPPQPSSYLPYYNYSASPHSLLSSQGFSYVFTGTLILFFYGAVV